MSLNLKTAIEAFENSARMRGGGVSQTDTGILDGLRNMFPGYPTPGSTSGWSLVDNALSLAKITIDTTVDSIYLVEDLLVAGEQLGAAIVSDLA